MKKFVGLIILDGYGIDVPSKSNSVYLAKTPYMDYLLKTYPNNTLEASGLAVGLPKGQMGNSEVGHLNLGAGRIVFQSLSRINQAIEDQSFFTNPAFIKAIEHAQTANSKLHILGLASDGGVHSDLNHLMALDTLAKRHGITPWFHLFLDGRDTPPTSAYTYVKTLLENNLNIASIQGRYYGMDRDNNWDRIQKGYDVMTCGDAIEIEPLKGIEASYQSGITDEFVKPFLTNKKGVIQDNDAIIFANFRPDRAIRIATALSNPSEANFFHTEGKASFVTNKPLKNIFFVSMMHYHEKVKGELAYPLQSFDNLYGEVISKNNLKQVRIAETEKYPHVTFFFDGGKEVNLLGSDRILVESPKVATYDLKPEMSAYEVKDKAVAAILSEQYDTMILNFANPDMVGHTGSIEATIKACETVDICLKEVCEAIFKIGGVAIVLADHGNAEKMLDENNQPHTAHTTNLVPVVITKENITVNHGKLADVAVTMLDLLGIKKPVEMTGQSLIKKD